MITAESSGPPAQESWEPESRRAAAWLNWSGFFFALLQSVCTIFLAVTGARVVLGMATLALAAGTVSRINAFHSAAVRLPMMAFALVGSLFNLYVLWHIRWLRNRPAARWRLQPLSAKKRRSERAQFILSVATLVLLIVEWCLHLWLHGTWR